MFIKRGQSAAFTVPAGQSVRVGALQGSSASITIPQGMPGGPIQALSNAQATYGPFITATRVAVVAIAGDVEYVVGVSPVLSTSEIVNSVFNRKIPAARIRYITNLTLASCDSRTFGQIFQTPITGPALVRANYRTDYSAGTTTITATAFAGGRSVSEVNPKQADGSAPSWSVVGACTLTASSPNANLALAAGDGLYGQGSTAFAYVNIPPAIDGGLGGYVYTLARTTDATAPKCCVDIRSEDYQLYANARNPAMKYRSMFNASGDNVTVNQNSFTPDAAAFQTQYHFIDSIDVIPVGGAQLTHFAIFGDSIDAGLGNGTPTVQPFGYSPISAMANAFNLAGKPCTFSSYGSSGKGAVFINGRARAQLADPLFRPSVAIMPLFTSNDSFGASSIQAGIALGLETAALYRAQGVPFVFRDVLPANDGASASAERIAAIARVVAAGVPIISYTGTAVNAANLPYPQIYSSLTIDGVHLNAVGNGMEGTTLGNYFGTYSVY